MTPVPSSLLTDALEYRDLLWGAYESGHDPHPLAASLVARNLECRRRGEVNQVLQSLPALRPVGSLSCGRVGGDPRAGARELLAALASPAGLDGRDLALWHEEFTGKAGELALASGYAVGPLGEGRAAQQLLMAMLGAARAFKSSV